MTTETLENWEEQTKGKKKKLFKKVEHGLINNKHNFTQCVLNNINVKSTIIFTPDNSRNKCKHDLNIPVGFKILIINAILIWFYRICRI